MRRQNIHGERAKPIPKQVLMASYMLVDKTYNVTLMSRSILHNGGIWCPDVIT